MTGFLLAKNRKAFYDHRLVEKYTAGVVLQGSEVKALREKKASFEGSYIMLMKGRPCLINLYIGQYSKQGRGYSEQESKRTRELLLTKHEIEALRRHLQQKGLTAIPTAIILLNGKVKLEFAVVKGKKEFEKKQTAKERQIDRDLQAVSKDFRRYFGQ